MKKSREERPEQEHHAYNRPDIVLMGQGCNVILKYAALESLENNEVADGGKCQRAPQRPDVAICFTETEAEDKAGNPHHKCTHHKRNGHGGKDSQYHGQALLFIDVLKQRTGEHLTTAEDCHADACTQQTEYKCYRCGGW